MPPKESKGRGVLPINVSQTKKPFKQVPRPAAPRLRLIIRRLPPGLTEPEFLECIGSEWQVGKGKVDWAAYKPGKISKDLAKPSRPSRAYLRVKEPAHLDTLSAHVRATTFQDVKNSSRDSCLIGPPLLEFAPYNKVPSGRVRHDGRQGTIDQDPEFIDFLQSLTELPTKAPANGDANGTKLEKPSVTPLVQYIKDKKANKAKEKEAAAAKATKKGQDAKDAKTSSPSKAEQTTVIKKSAPSEAEKARIAKATQQAVDSIKKSVAEIKGQKGQATPTKQEAQLASQTPSSPAQSAPTPKKERQRGDASAAARIINRDLGLVPKEGRSPRTPRSVSTPAGPANVPPKGPAAMANTPSPPAATASQSPNNASVQPPTGPRNPRNTNNTPQPSPLRPSAMPPQTQNTKPAKQPPQPSPGAKSAFLKHANPSQGVTEDLLRTSLSVHGAITRCEIDRKKGLGYIDFAETEGLRKAMAASPVKVGNGSVVVLENKSPYKKVPQQPPSRPNTASPLTSGAPSPQVTHAALESVVGQPFKQANVQEPVIISSTSTEPLNIDPAATGSTTITETEAVTSQPTTDAADTPLTPTDPNAPMTTASQSTLSNAPRGGGTGRANQRGQYRGRGYRGKGSRGGGNRAASTPLAGSAAASNSTNTPAPPVPAVPGPSRSGNGPNGKS